MESEFQCASFRVRPIRSSWGAAGPRPQSMDKFGTARLGMRMGLPDGATVVMPLGRLNRVSSHLTRVDLTKVFRSRAGDVSCSAAPTESRKRYTLPSGKV
jgi:hypothetical protein